MVDKRGSHVGMVVSFVVFITFIVFLYIVIEPTIKMNKDKQIVLDHLKDEVVKKVSGELITYSFKIKDSDGVIPPTADCFSVNSSLGDFSSVGCVVTSESNIVGSGITSDGLLNIGENDIRNKFYQAYYSKEFTNNLTEFINCYRIDPVNYTVGSLRTENSVFEKKILFLINDYNKNYEPLKIELGIPSGSEFSLGFIYEDYTEIKTAEKNVSINVYAEKVAVKYLDNNASLNNGYINIKVW